MSKGEDLHIVADDGFALAATRYKADPAHATVVIAGAAATPRRYYRHLAAKLAATGFETLTFDYRGTGGSRPRSLRGFHATMHDWGALDLSAAISWGGGRAQRRFLIGHSAGGQLLGLASGAEALDAIYLAAVSSGYYGLWDGWQRLAIYAAFQSIPRVARLFGYLPYGLLGGQDVPLGMAQQWCRWGRHPDYIVSAGARFAHIRAPLRVLSFTDDFFASERAVDALIGWYTTAQVEHRRVAPQDVGLHAIGHFGFYRRTAATTLWPDALDWLTAHARQCTRPLDGTHAAP